MLVAVVFQGRWLLYPSGGLDRFYGMNLCSKVATCVADDVGFCAYEHVWE